MTVTLAASGTAVTIGNRADERHDPAARSRGVGLDDHERRRRWSSSRTSHTSRTTKRCSRCGRSRHGRTRTSRIRAGRSGSKYIRLRTDASMRRRRRSASSNRRGWAGYLRNGTLFVKRVDWTKAAAYPDFGVNTETYTAGNFVELETLGPMTPRSTRRVGLARGALVALQERECRYLRAGAGRGAPAARRRGKIESHGRSRAG